MALISTVLAVLYRNAVENIWFTKERVRYIREHANRRLSHNLHSFPTDPVIAAITIFFGVLVVVAACMIVYGNWGRDIHGNPIKKNK